MLVPAPVLVLVLGFGVVTVVGGSVAAGCVVVVERGGRAVVV